MFAESGVTDAMLARGYIVRNYQYRDRRTGVVADFDLGALADDTPYPYRLMLEQHKICYILLDKLKQYSALRGADGASRRERHARTATASPPPSRRRAARRRFADRWMIGCDGGRSQVRKSMNVDFSGFTYEERFLILSTRYDFEPFGYALTNYIADPDEWCALFKVPGHDERGIWRVVFPVDAHRSAEEIFEEGAVQRRIQGFHRKDGDYEVFHRNLYDVHQRVASCYRDGRLLIAGDAAHINNPLGGMGMNFGFHDAFNLTEQARGDHPGWRERRSARSLRPPAPHRRAGISPAPDYREQAQYRAEGPARAREVPRRAARHRRRPREASQPISCAWR